MAAAALHWALHEFLPATNSSARAGVPDLLSAKLNAAEVLAKYSMRRRRSMASHKQSWGTERRDPAVRGQVVEQPRGPGRHRGEWDGPGSGARESSRAGARGESLRTAGRWRMALRPGDSSNIRGNRNRNDF